MAYVLGQYNKNQNVADDSIFMTLVTEGTAKHRKSTSDSGVGGVSDIFYNECIQTGGFSNTKNYYFHGKIKRMTSDQTFYVKLVNYDDESSESVEQYIKTVTVAKGDPNDWVNVEFIFTPLVIFDTLLFELQRTVEDYREEVRYPIIIYEEISEINNIIPRRISDGVELIKIGVQSHPGLLMCINGEEIRTNRSGIYELKNGIMLVSFFSVVAGAAETTSSMTDTMNAINVAWEQAEALSTAAQREAAKRAIYDNYQINFIATSKKRSIDSFTMDYMYREE
jgi:hypothetical protein